MGCINSKASSGRQGTDCVERESFRSNKSLKISFDEIENEGCDAAALLVPSSCSSNDKANKSISVISSEDSENKHLVPASAAANGRTVQDHSIASPSAYGAAAALAMDQWPPWLSAVAGDAIRGWSPQKAESFEKLEKIGHGTYSSVYRARDLDSGKIVALKKVRFANMDPESVSFMSREIIVLRRLDHPNIMKLEGLITSRSSCSLYLVFQYMEHDLLGLQAAPGVKFTETQIKCFMRQLLCGLDHCHTHGVLHRDIKGANLLLDNKGNLRIGDFGLATIFNPRKRQPLTSRVVTLWYRPPELLLGSSEYGVGVDLWSAGCILAELFTGNPIMPGRTEVEQLHKIFKLCGSPSEEYWRNSKLPHATIFKPQQPYKRRISETFKDLPPSALALLEVLLAINPKSRGTASDALHSEFFSAEPLPCDPSSLPKYPPSKEFDAKFKNEGARGRRGDTGRQYTQEANQILPSENKAIPGRYGNSEFQQQQTHRKSISLKYDADEYGDNRVGQPVEPRRGVPNNLLLSNSSWTVKPARLGSPRTMNEDGKVSRPNTMNVPNLRSQRSFMVRGVQQLSLVGVQERSQSQWPGESFNGTSSLLKSESPRHLLGILDSSQQNGYLAKEQLVYDAQRKRIHCSGPLLPLGGNTYDMLREHEKQVQREVRRDRNGKVKMSRLNRGDTELDESLLPRA